MKKLTAVIVNYNKCDMLISCIKSLYNSARIPDNIILVDNASTDGSANKIRKLFKDIKIIENKENTGGTEGFNTGMREALKTNCDYIYLLDNDVELEKYAISNLIKALGSDKTVGAAGSKGLYFHDKTKIWQAGCFFSSIFFCQIINGRNKPDSKKYNKTLSVDFMPAFSLMLKREVIEKTKGMDKRFFVYIDDIDWGLRIKKAGWKILYVPNSVVLHHVSAFKSSPFSVYYGARNLLFLFKRNFSPWIFPFIYLSFILRNIIRMIIIFITGKKTDNSTYMKIFFAFLYAHLDFFMNKLGKSDYY